MIIHFVSTSNRRKVAREGDRKVVRGFEYVRQQVRVTSGPDRGCLVVSRGRPVYEWVRAAPAPGKVVSVDALQGLCEEWENMKVPRSADSYELGMFDGYRGARRDLTAILGEGD